MVVPTSYSCYIKSSQTRLEMICWQDDLLQLRELTDLGQGSWEIWRPPSLFCIPPSCLSPKKLDSLQGPSPIVRGGHVLSRLHTRQPATLIPPHSPIPLFLFLTLHPPPPVHPLKKFTSGHRQQTRLSWFAYIWNKGDRAPNQKLSSKRNLKFGKIHPAVSLQIILLSLPPFFLYHFLSRS